MLNRNGNRIIYDHTTGRIEHQTCDSEGTREHQPITELTYVDLPYGYIDYNKSYIELIDPETGRPIIKDYELTDDQKKFKEMEDELLLLVDNEIGGIL